jgi:hypothetical protein
MKVMYEFVSVTFVGSAVSLLDPHTTVNGLSGAVCDDWCNVQSVFASRCLEVDCSSMSAATPTAATTFRCY